MLLGTHEWSRITLWRSVNPEFSLKAIKAEARTMYLYRSNLPLLKQMPAQAASESPLPLCGSPPANDPLALNPPNNAGDQLVEGIWKRKYYELRATVDDPNPPPPKRKSTHVTDPMSPLGRGIRRVIFLCGDINSLLSEGDKHYTYFTNPDDEELNTMLVGLGEDAAEDMKLGWKRSYNAVKELDLLIPGFLNKVDEGSPEELNSFYRQLQHHADSARSDDLSRVRGCIALWLNEAEPAPSPMLKTNCRQNRGLGHDLIGGLLCPADFNWQDLTTRAKIRAADPNYNWLGSFHSKVFYANYEADPDNLELGYLKSTLLVRVFKAIFTSPSSAQDASEDEDDAENIPPAKLQKITSRGKPVRRNVASKLHLNNKVMPRSLAYAAVQLHFNLQNASHWSPVFGGFDYEGLHNYIVDFFEDAPGPAMQKRGQELLDWWSVKVFPAAALHRQSNVTVSRKEFKKQRAALEDQGTN